MTIQLEYETDVQIEVEYSEVAKIVADKVLETEEFPYEAEINLVITDNEEIKRVNQEFRDIHAPTDVLSFPMIPFETPVDYDVIEEDINSYVDPDSEEIVLGDIMISAEKVIEQAREYGHSQKREFAFLVAHSMLHLLGYDHMTPEEASVMEEKQRIVLEILGISR
ncbi:MAG: rRNA maturation RNase YbeY [Eubacteriales bacterium]|nr:rRNA maturation RNase YbeY [Eubacteriales bacterium]